MTDVSSTKRTKRIMPDTPFNSINPATGNTIQSWPLHKTDEIEATLERAYQLHADWNANDTRSRRLNALRKLAARLREQSERIANTITREMGKPIAEARAEVTKCAWVCEWYADHADSMLEPRQIETNADHSEVRFEALGPLLAIMPWNFPLWQVFRAVAPALALGNPVLLKHAPNVTACAEICEKLVLDATGEAGALTVLRVDVDQIGAIIEDRRVAAVTLTGSERAGRAVAAQAGAALKPIVLELGGSDPFIVLDDADLNAAVDAACESRMRNAGQSCIAAKRFIVQDGVYELFLRRFAERIAALTVDDPSFDSTDIGPLAREDLRETLDEQVQATRHAGARVVSGGQPHAGPGFYYAPTLLADVPQQSRCWTEEVFGPVACAVPARNLDEAIQLANNTRFGLGASLWTRRKNASAIATRIDAGHVAINGGVASDPRLPFGGIKASGIGRELSREGLLAFANIKTVWKKEA